MMSLRLFSSLSLILVKNNPGFLQDWIQEDVSDSLFRHRDVDVDPGGGIDHRGRVEHCVDWTIVFHFICPRISWLNLIRATVANSRESFANTWGPVAQTDVAKIAACIAKFDKSAVFNGLDEYAVTRCGTF